MQTGPILVRRVCRRRLGGGAAALGTVLAVTACGQSNNSASDHTHGFLDTTRVARAIQQSIESERHLASSVICPPRIPQEQGLAFTCVATTYKLSHQGRKSLRLPLHTTFTVVQQNDRGNVYYHSHR